MNIGFRILSLYLFLCLINISTQKICGTQDVGKMITDCDHQSQREGKSKIYK